ncbi:MAG: HDOD domain-containing protein [Opitutaceae bacterium]|jgi:HD-like signal output (HDOD) protein
MPSAFTRDSLEFELHHLSSAPRIIPKLAVLVNDPNMDPDDVIEVIRHDPALTTRLIAACKSAAIHHGTDVTNVSEAVGCLGFAQVYRIAVVVAFRSGFCSRFQVYEESADATWQRAVATACFMEEFALEDNGDLGMAYTIGLLHMIGMFLLDWHCAQIPGARIPVRNLARQLEMERKLSAFTHMEATALALDFWGFPKEIYEPIRWYDRPKDAGAFETNASHLQLAVCLSHELGAPAIKSVFGVKNRPHLSPGGQQLDSIIPKVQRKLQAAIDFLRL